jgi:septal ring factor EnvC (AmiA/AmiB activator)
MVIATITAITVLIFAVGGGGGGFSFGVFKPGVKDHVSDKHRAKQIIAVTKQADKEVEALTKDLNKVSKELTKLNSSYDATRGELKQSLDQLDERRAKFQERIIDLRFKARDLMTQEEWQAVYARAREETSR